MARSSQQRGHIALSDPYCLAQVPWYLVGIYCLAFKASIFGGDGSQIPELGQKCQFSGSNFQGWHLADRFDYPTRVKQ